MCDIGSGATTTAPDCFASFHRGFLTASRIQFSHKQDLRLIPASNKTSLRLDDMGFDKSLLKPCPVLLPSAEEFENPIEYLSKPEILKLGNEYGIVKVVPPSGWKPPFSIAPSFTFHTRVQKLSDLGVTTRSRRIFIDGLNRFFKMTGRRTTQPWFFAGGRRIHYYDLYLAVSRISPSLNLNDLNPEEASKLNVHFGLPAAEKILVTLFNDKVKEYAQFLANNKDNFDFPESDPEDNAESCLICRKSHSPTQMLLCDNCNNPYHLKCLLPPRTEVPEGSWYCEKCLIGSGEYGFEENPDLKFNIWQFMEHCRKFESDFFSRFSASGKPFSLDEIEKLFWELVESENSDLKVRYGADIHNLRPGEISGFPTLDVPHSPYDKKLDGTTYIKHPWNLTQLPFAKGSLLNYIDSSISGMTIPWIYVGSLLSTFCWHVEDHYTLSANYCHFGNVKKWYGIPSSYADEFERTMKTLAPDLFQRQPDLLHQLVTLISPSDLVAKGIPCVYADQGPNEFVVTYPRVYHAGFNSGVNFNEAVNFTMDTWMEFGERSIRDYIGIRKENVFDHYKLVQNILEKWLAGEIVTQQKDLVSKCVRSYEEFLLRQRSIFSDLKSDRLHIMAKAESKSWPITPVPEMRMMTTKRPKGDEDDVLCDICRTFLSFQYCHINNKLHRFGRWYLKKPKFDTPRISVRNLLTPTPSPLVGDGAEGTMKCANAVARSESAGKLQRLQDEEIFIPLKREEDGTNESEEEDTDHQYHTPALDQLEALILQAKRQASEEIEEPKGKRRQSRRLQPKHKVLEPKVKREVEVTKQKNEHYSSLLRQLNQFDQLKLCLKCTQKMCGERGERLPKGSSIVVEKLFEEMEHILAETKRKLLGLV